MSNETQHNASDADTEPTEWRQQWVDDLRYFHASDKELSDLMEGGNLSRRAVAHLVLCVTCRERLAFEIEGAVLEQSQEGHALETFVRFLHHKDNVVRASAARAVVSLAEGLPATVQQLMALNDAEQMVSQDVAFALSALREDGTVTAAAARVVDIRSRRTETRARLAEWLEQVRYAAGLPAAAAAPLKPQSPDALNHAVISENDGLDLRISVSSYDRQLEGTLIHVDPFGVSFTLQLVVPGEVGGGVVVPKAKRENQPPGETIRLRVDTAPESGA